MTYVLRAIRIGIT